MTEKRSDTPDGGLLKLWHDEWRADVAKKLSGLQRSMDSLKGRGDYYMAHEHIVSVLQSCIAAIDGARVSEKDAPAVTTEMVDRFLSWPLPESVCSDGCVTERDYCTKRGYPRGARSGTSLLTADEARQMLEHVLRGTPVSAIATRAVEGHCGTRWEVGADGNLVTLSFDSLTNMEEFLKSLRRSDSTSAPK